MGKTLAAKVVASQCGAHFLSVDMKKETGGGIRKWFIRERENKPSVLFFDEIDSIATSRDIGEDVNSQAIAEKTEKNETDPETVPQEGMKKLR